MVGTTLINWFLPHRYATVERHSTPRPPSQMRHRFLLSPFLPADQHAILDNAEDACFFAPSDAAWYAA